MKENREWNPYYMNSPYTMNPEQRAFPWLYPYGNQMNYWSLWNSPERMEDEMDTISGSAFAAPQGKGSVGAGGERRGFWRSGAGMGTASGFDRRAAAAGNDETEKEEQKPFSPFHVLTRKKKLAKMKYKSPAGACFRPFIMEKINEKTNYTIYGDPACFCGGNRIYELRNPYGESGYDRSDGRGNSACGLCGEGRAVI